MEYQFKFLTIKGLSVSPSLYLKATLQILQYGTKMTQLPLPSQKLRQKFSQIWPETSAAYLKVLQIQAICTIRF